MDKREAIDTYTDDPELWKALIRYSNCDRSFTVNDNDPDLEPISISLPDPPEWHLIDGFGLPAKEQKFKRAEYPQKLVVLQRDTIKRIEGSRTTAKNGVFKMQSVIDSMWDTLNNRQSEYRSEIEWIKRQIYFLHHGYWVFINGKPTYLDGWHYRYLNYWDMTDTVVSYRDRDRRFFLFARYVYTSTETSDGLDIGHRTLLGFNYPKHRRDGATHKSLCIGYDIVTKVIGAVVGGIQSFDDNNAGEHYTEKLIPAFKAMSFFLKPIWRGTQAPQSELSFSRIGNEIGDELGSKIDFATTANRKFYDGKKLYYYQGEEEGKTILEKVDERWSVVRQTLAQGAGANIVGFSIHPTTVAEMEDKGGAAYLKLCNDSRFYERNKDTGQTKSGLVRLFIPAYDGLEGFIGPFGESIVDDPTKEQAEFIGRNIGAKRFLQSQLDEYIKRGDPDSMIQYRELKRLFPMCYADCFRNLSGDAGLDVEKLDAGIDRLRREAMITSPTVSGNMKWIVDGESDPLSAKDFLLLGYDRSKSKEMRVEFFPHKEGRWKLSKILNSQESNQRYKIDGVWYPMYPFKFTEGADPFQFLKKQDAEKRSDKGRLSKGGISVFYERDRSIDPDSKDVSLWSSYRFVCTYDNRTDDDDEFAEEALMTAVYFGAECYPETNVKIVWKHFVKRGFEGFLKYGVDEATGEKKDAPGFTSLTESKQDLFNAIKRYIYHHSTREKHIDFLIQCRAIKGLDYMTDFDLFTACGAALLGSQVVRYESELMEDQSGSLDISGGMPIYTY